MINDGILNTIHSDIDLTSPLASNRSPLQNSMPHGVVSLHSSLNLPRSSINNSSFFPIRKRYSHHRRNLSGIAAVTRDRKNSFSRLLNTKVEEQQSISLPSQSLTTATPLTRDTKAILEEHLKMIRNVLLSYSCNASIHNPSQNSSVRDFIYRHLREISMTNPMKERCSRIETKAFIDSITSYHMRRSHHYQFLLNSIRNLLKSTVESSSDANYLSETDDEITKDSSNANYKTALTNSAASPVAEIQMFKNHPLKFFRTLSEDYIADCEQTEQDLTKKLFDIADKQHILYCLKHVDSGHTNDLLSIFHRRLDAIVVWYNLYYELTISVKKLSGLLRCDDCDDWPKLYVRSLATERERKAKRALDNDDDYYTSSEDGSDDDEIKENDMEEDVPLEHNDKDQDEMDILPKINWSDEPLDQLSTLKTDATSSPTNSLLNQKLDRTACYR